MQTQDVRDPYGIDAAHAALDAVPEEHHAAGAPLARALAAAYHRASRDQPAGSPLGRQWATLAINWTAIADAYAIQAALDTVPGSDPYRLVEQ